MSAERTAAERTWRRLDTAPGGTAWAAVTTPEHPPLAERHPAPEAWRDLRIDPGLHGLVPGRARPARVVLGRAGDGGPWELPVSAVLGTGLAWHPDRPLVAGLAVRDRRAYPWVADLGTRTVVRFPHIRAATSAHGLGGAAAAPLAWCGADRLALLVPAPPEPDPGDAGSGEAEAPVLTAFEAAGPGFIDFAAPLSALHRLIGARAAVLDTAGGGLRVHGPPLLVRGLSAAPSGHRLLLDRAAGAAAARSRGSAGDGIRWAAAVVDTRDTTEPLYPPGPAEWAAGPADVLAMRVPAADGLRVRFQDLDGGGAEVAVAGEPPRRWWPLWHRGAPLLLGDGGDALVTADEQETVREPLPAGLRLGRPAAAPPESEGGTGHGSAVAAFDCRFADGATGAAVLTGGPRGLVAAPAPPPPAGDGAARGARAAYGAEGPVLLVEHDTALHRYRWDAAAPRPVSAHPLPGTGAAPAPAPTEVPIGHPGARLALLAGPPATRPRPVLLWIRPHAEGGAPTASVPPAAAEHPVALLDLPLPWSGGTGPAELRGRITGAVRAALAALREHHGDRCDGRAAVGGHSFGATIALYALAHLPELLTAVAHSGCYNRTRTPAGFQDERRSYWQAPELYRAFSALLFADRLDRPVLIAHGAADANPATPPEQAVELYTGIVAAGGHARLLLLPGEGHTFHYRESMAALADEHRAWLGRWAGGAEGGSSHGGAHG